MYKVSIVIPVYNAQKSLDICLSSIKNQTFADFEVIMVNDGSTDNSADICESFCKQDNRFRLINQCNSGPSAARNKGIESSEAKYLYFVDSDDWIEPDTIEQFYNVAEENEADMTVCSFIEENGDNSIKKNTTAYPTGLYVDNKCREVAINSICYSKAAIPPYSWMRFVRRQCLIDSGFRFNTNIHKSEDYLLWTKVFFSINRLYLMTDKYLYHYVITEGSLTHKYIKNYFDMAKIIYDDLIEALPSETKIINEIKSGFILRTYVAMNNATYADSLKVLFGDLHNIFKDKTLKKVVQSLSYKDFSGYVKSSYWFLKLRLYPALYLIYLKKYLKK